MKIYISSFFDTRARLKPIKEKLWEMGHEITSSWLDEVAKPQGMDTNKFYKKLAIKDLAEVRACDIFIIDTEDISPRGGREVEFGAAIASVQPKFIYVVGPLRNVFHHLRDKDFCNWDECLQYVRENHAIYPSSPKGVLGITYTGVESEAAI